MTGALFILLALAIFATLAKQFLASPTFKGKLGETLVVRALERQLPASRYTTLHDVTLPSRDGTTQIDHIVLSSFGIFVIETKHMSGWIFGSEGEKTWTQKFRRSSVKFQNPLHQNYGHIKTLEVLLELASDRFHSLVVFTGDAEFKKSLPENVTGLDGMVKYIQTHTDSHIDLGDIPSLVAKIESNRLAPGRETHAAHVASLKERKDALTGAVSETRGLIRQASSALALIKIGFTVVVVAGTLLIFNQLVGYLSKVAAPNPMPAPAVQPTAVSEGPSGDAAITTSTPSLNAISKALLSGPSAALERARTDAAQGKEERASQEQLEWESSLLCAYSEDTGRCACYEPKGPKASVTPELCMTLAMKGTQ